MKSVKILVILMVSILMSCGPRVQTEITTDKNLREYSTYAFLPNSNQSVDDKQYQDPVLNQAIVEAIHDNLQQEGYKLDQDNPDLLVLVSTKIQERRKTSIRPRYSYYPYRFGVRGIHPMYNPYYYYGYMDFGPFAGYDVDEYPYEEGTVIIYLVDRETERTVWKGIATEGIYNQNEPRAVANLIDAVFEVFP
jgi:hypothetical protein